MKIFISSPVKGYEKVRQACKEALDFLGLDYFISESEGSIPQSSINVCLREVNACDIYIVLLGDRYGSIHPNFRKSITELEFDEAKKRDRPILAYKLQFFDYEDRQKKFIQKVEDLIEGVFRGTEVPNEDVLRKRVASDVVNFIALKNELNSLEFTGSLKACCLEMTRKAISEKVYSDSDRRLSMDTFFDKMYVPRRIEEWILRFLTQEERSTCMVVGRAGCGKTSVLCRIAKGLLSERSPILFYNVRYLNFDRNLALMICSDSSVPALDGAEGFRKIMRFLTRGGERLTIIFDAINEVDNEVNKAWLKKELANLSSMSDGRTTRILMTCRDIDWEYFKRNNPRLEKNLFIEESFVDTTLLALRMGDFDENEKRDSFEKYRKVFDFKGDFTPKIASICSNPWMLRLVSETYANSILPTDVRVAELFQKYYQKKLENTGEAEYSSIILRTLASLIFDYGKESVPIARIVRESRMNIEIAIRALKRLLSENLIQLRRIEGKEEADFLDLRVHCTYDRFMEFLIAKVLIERWDAIDSLNEFKSWLKSQVDKIQKYRFGLGAIEFFLLLIDNDNLRREGIELLKAMEDPVWKVVALSVSNKTENWDLSEKIINELINDEDWRSRLKLSISISENFDEIPEDLRNELVFTLLNDIKEEVCLPIIPCFISNYRFFDEFDRKEALRKMARVRNKRVANALCFAVYEGWKRDTLKCEEELLEEIIEEGVSIPRHMMAYLAMRHSKNSFVRDVLKKAILSDLLVESNYVYGPWCITIGNLYLKEQSLFNKIIPLLLEEKGYKGITDRIRTFIKPVVGISKFVEFEDYDDYMD